MNLDTTGKYRSAIRTASCLLLLAVWVLRPSGVHGSVSAARHYLLATANTAGTYYPVGVALATLTKIKLEPAEQVSLTAISTAGSAENLHRLAVGEVQFSLLQGLYGYWAWNGIGPFAAQGPQRHLRAVTMLWQNVEHFAVKTDYLRTGTIDDLKAMRGKTMSLGEEHSGSAGSGLHILRSLGFDPEDDFELVNLRYGESADAMQKGDIQAMNIPGGPPVAAVARVFKVLGKDISILGFSEQQIASINSEYALWSRFVIEPGTYTGQDSAVETIAQPNFLAVHKNVSDKDVYLILKTIYANLSFLHNIHPITRAMSLGAAIDGLPIPLHPGAARFYRENGVNIPDALITR